MKRNIVGYAILTCTILLLFTLVFFELVSQRSAFSIVLAVGIVGLLFGLFTEWNHIKRAFHEQRALPLHQRTGGVSLKKRLVKDVQILLAICCSSVLTYTLSVHTGLGAVVAAGLVGLAAGLLFPELAAPIYCGAFVGMVGPQVLPLYFQVLLASFIAGCIYVMTADIVHGFGGKLGTVALVGCLTSIMLTRNSPQTLSALSFDLSCIIVLCTIVSSVVTYMVNTRVLHNPVLASSLMGLTGGLILPHLFPEAGSTIAAAVICASFAGMSSQKRAGHEIAMAFTGALVGFMFVFAYPFLGGTGGKLGTIAFGSVMIVRGMLDIYDALKVRFTPKTEQV